MNAVAHAAAFPYGFVGTFIEAAVPLRTLSMRSDFPSFWEGLPLRLGCSAAMVDYLHVFPSCSGGLSLRQELSANAPWAHPAFLHLRVGSFIEEANGTGAA